MSSSADSSADGQFLTRTIEAAIRIGLIVIVSAWCFRIMEPFTVPVLWGVIIAIACMPVFRWLATKLGGRARVAAIVFVVVFLAAVIAPIVMLAGSMAETAQSLHEELKEGTLSVPAPPKGIEDWPVIGKEVGSIWRGASLNLEAIAQRVLPHIKGLAVKLLSVAAGAGVVVLHFVIAVAVAAVLLVNADACGRISKQFARRLSSDRGEEMADTATAVVRSVAQGVLGVAFIQSLLAGIGMLVVAVPAAGLWALLVLILAILQLPTLLVLLPVALYVFAHAGTAVAIGFLIWMILVGVSDSFLKPLLLGRGVKIPMLVVLVGSLGGLIASGIIGLFIGPVVLALGYQLFMTWLRDTPGALASDPGD